jgi:hypothetical protein
MSFLERSNRIEDQSVSHKFYSRNEYGGPLNSATYYRSRPFDRQLKNLANDDLKSSNLNSKTEIPKVSSSVTCKIAIAIVLFIGFAAVLGGSSYLTYYLGTQSKPIY